MKAPENAAAAFAVIKARADARLREIKHDRPVIMVGAATCGRAAGALDVIRAFRDEIKKHNIECPVVETGCIGHCYAEPVVIIRKPGYPPVAYGYVNPAIAERLVNDFILDDNPCLEFVLAALEPNDIIPAFQEFPRAKYERKIIMKNCGLIEPASIDDYIAAGGYAALAKTLGSSPQNIINEVKRSGLRGRGGAGFPAGEKWQTCCGAGGKTKYIICNADEGDPGAFADRSLLESDPYSVIEGMIIAAYAVGASQGYIYVRAEYPLAVERLTTALDRAGKANLTGRHILGTNFSFDITLLLKH